MAKASNLEQLVQELRSAAGRKDEMYAESFEFALGKIAALDDPGIIRALIEFFDDAAPYDEVMFSLIHTIEKFDDKVFVNHLLASLPGLVERSPRWASIILMRGLNNDLTREELVRQARQADTSVKEALKWLAEKINERGPTFLSKTTPLLLAVN